MFTFHQNSDINANPKLASTGLIKTFSSDESQYFICVLADPPLESAQEFMAISLNPFVFFAKF